MVLRRSSRRQRQLCTCYGRTPLNVELLTHDGAGPYQLYLVSICRTERSPWLRHRRSPGQHARPSRVGSLRRPGERPSGLAGPGLLIGLVGALERFVRGRFGRPSASSVGRSGRPPVLGGALHEQPLWGRTVRRTLSSPGSARRGMMAGFMQIIEMQPSRIDVVEVLIGELRGRLDDGGSSAPRRAP
jgi:hypothetical protein